MLVWSMKPKQIFKEEGKLLWNFASSAMPHDSSVHNCENFVIILNSTKNPFWESISILHMIMKIFCITRLSKKKYFIRIVSCFAIIFEKLK